MFFFGYMIIFKVCLLFPWDVEYFSMWDMLFWDYALLHKIKKKYSMLSLTIVSLPCSGTPERSISPKQTK